MSDPKTASDLIERARLRDPEALGLLLEARRAALRAQAERRLRGRLAARVDASDLVQLTFIEAHRDFDRFQGEGERAFAAWLGRILDNNIAATLRDHAFTGKRDLRRERPLAQDPDQGGADPSALHAAASTPSQRMIRAEFHDQIAAALATLPGDQREAVRMRHLENLPLAEIARRLDRSPSATAGLIKRGMEALRRRLGREV